MDGGQQQGNKQQGNHGFQKGGKQGGQYGGGGRNANQGPLSAAQQQHQRLQQQARGMRQNVKNMGAYDPQGMFGHPGMMGMGGPFMGPYGRPNAGAFSQPFEPGVVTYR